MARLKVWRLSVGTEDVVIAETSIVKAAAACRGWSAYAFKEYAGEPGPDTDSYKQAMTEPGTAFTRPIDWKFKGHDGSWTAIVP